MHLVFASTDEYLAEMTWVPESVLVTGSKFCEVHRSHAAAQPDVLLRWHNFPKVLQMQVWGDVLDDNSQWVCPNAWYSARALLLKAVEAGEWPKAGTSILWYDVDALRLARDAWDALLDAKRDMASRRAVGPAAVDISRARCDKCGGGFVPHLNMWLHTCRKEPQLGPPTEPVAARRVAGVDSLASLEDE